MKPSEFILFDPHINSPMDVPDACGNYIIVLKQGSHLPKTSITPIMSKFKGYNVIYTGIAGKSLRNRDVKNHFSGNAGGSTLRKSLGCLMGYGFIPRDKCNPDNGKVKFSDKDETALSIWMIKNLLLFYNVNDDYASHELELINKYNPPLNLKDNHNPINAEYRAILSKKRANKPTAICNKDEQFLTYIQNYEKQFYLEHNNTRREDYIKKDPWYNSWWFKLSFISFLFILSIILANTEG